MTSNAFALEQRAKAEHYTTSAAFTSALNEFRETRVNSTEVAAGFRFMLLHLIQDGLLRPAGDHVNNAMIGDRPVVKVHEFTEAALTLVDRWKTAQSFDDDH